MAFTSWYAKIGNWSANPKLTEIIQPQNVGVNTKETLTDFSQHQKIERDFWSNYQTQTNYSRHRFTSQTTQKSKKNQKKNITPTPSATWNGCDHNENAKCGNLTHLIKYQKTKKGLQQPSKPHPKTKSSIKTPEKKQFEAKSGVMGHLRYVRKPGYVFGGLKMAMARLLDEEMVRSSTVWELARDEAKTKARGRGIEEGG